MTRPEAQDWRTSALTPEAPTARSPEAPAARSPEPPAALTPEPPPKDSPPERIPPEPDLSAPSTPLKVRTDFRRTDPRIPAARGPRRAKLQVRRVDPWSVLKFSLVFSVVLAIVLVVAVAVIYLLLSGMGVFDSVNKTVSSFREGTGNAPLFTATGVIGVAVVIGLADVVLFTALATLGAFAYNLCADLVGGIEVTLSEHD
ncbi:MAG: DUF3566 domain-containing protein [Mycobacteriales bacterium]